MLPRMDQQAAINLIQHALEAAVIEYGPEHRPRELWVSPQVWTALSGSKVLVLIRVAGVAITPDASISGFTVRSFAPIVCV